METLKEENLRRMSYAELKKHAKDVGINQRLRTDVLISAILKKVEDAEDSFVTLENQIMNSCEKNKIAKFEEDKEVESDTPRRETYTLESPSIDVSALDNDLIVSSASPVLKKTPPSAIETSLNITMSRGSERKMKSRKVSFVTPLRKSARISSMTPRFASVKDRPKTPIPPRFSSGKKSSPSLKAKISFTETPSEKEVENSSSTKSGGRRGKRVSTPMPSSKCKRMNLNLSGLNAPIATPEVSFSEPAKGKIVEEESIPDVKKPIFQFSATPENKRIASPKSGVKKTPAPVFKFTATPQLREAATPKSDVKKVGTPSALNVAKTRRLLTPKSEMKTASPHVVDPKNIRTLTPRSNIKKVATPLSTNPKSLRIATPKSLVKKSATPLSVSAKEKRTPRSCSKSAVTPSVLSAPKVKIPDFKELHKKNFEKMESIDEYQQRKNLNSAKKLKEQIRYQNLAKASASKLKAAVPKNKRIKKFGGIPFVPSITSTKDIKMDASYFGSQCMASKKVPAMSNNVNVLAKKAKTPVDKKLAKNVSRENTPLKRRFRFDLQASLTKKLPYKPHKGPLKPLEENNMNISMSVSAAPMKPTSKSTVVEAKRFESRNVLRGVRVNRRFELQMQKRKLASS